MLAERSYVIDPEAAIALAASGKDLPAGVKLLAPSLLRHQVLSRLHAAVAAGELDDKEGRRLVQAINELPIRLLGDGALRRHAWRVASELGWSETYRAEYVALTLRWADALVTSDPDLAEAVEGVVETAPLEVLLG